MGFDVVSQEQEEVIPTPEFESAPARLDIKDSDQVVISINNNECKDDVKMVQAEKMSSSQIDISITDKKAKQLGRFAILLIVVTIQTAGRFGVPDNEVPTVEDKVLGILEFANDFINTPGNEFFRDFFQALCSFMVDVVFFITFGYWVYKGSNKRLPMSLALFYATRALIQLVWYSPFPKGFYWESPGFPSLNVPYGRGSDFFFSGHTGFLVICALEWNKINFPRVRNFVICVALYTMLILMIYRIHYSIDIFTGVFFADWCYGKVDTHREVISEYIATASTKIRECLSMKPGKLLFPQSASLDKLNERTAV